MTILVITLIPLNPNTGLGWRSKKAGEMNCKGKNGKEFIKCVEDNSYASMNMTSDEEQLYVDDLFVMSQSLQVDPGEISDDPRTTIQIPINDSLMYHIVISDPKMQWTLYESVDIPQIYLYLRNTHRSGAFYMQVDIDFNSFHFNLTLSFRQ